MAQSRKEFQPRFGKPTTTIFTSAVDDDGIEASIESTDAFVTILKIDARGFRKFIAEIKNTDGSNSIDYKILGSRRWRDASVESETFWDGSSEDFREIKASTALAAGAYAIDEEVDLKHYMFIVVQIKATTPASQGDGLVRTVLS